MSEFKFTSPFQKPIEWRAPLNRGFIVFPHTPANPDGWGEPFETSSGAPIDPGTIDGPNPNVLVGVKGSGEDTHWTSTWSPSYQMAGPIDWKGPYINPDAKYKKRYVLSWWGPMSRYFNDGTFEYDSNEHPEYREIYMAGGVVGICPLPVLGAAIHTFEYTTTEGTITTSHKERLLVVVAKDGYADVALMRNLPASPYRKDSLTDEVREQLVAYADTENPEGWREVGRMLQQANGTQLAYAPETPWFFNEDGDEARTMRRTPYEFDDGSGSNVVEDVYIQYRVKFVKAELIENAIFTNFGRDPYDGFTFLEETEKYRQNWEYPAGHDWQEDIYENSVMLNGSLQIAVDFKENTPVYAWIVTSASRLRISIWQLGIDDPGEQDSNSGNTLGPSPPPHFYDFGSGWGVLTTLDYLSRYTQPAVGADERVWLRIGPSFDAPEKEIYLSYDLTLTRSTLQGIDDNSDVILYYWQGLFTYLHTMDLRYATLAGYSDLVERYYPGDGHCYTKVYKYEWADPEIQGGDIFSNLSNGTAIGFMAWNGPQDIETNSFQYFGWPRATMEGWDTTISQTITRQNMTGSWMNPNDGAAIYTPDGGEWDNDNMVLPETDGQRIWGVPHILYRVNNTPTPSAPAVYQEGASAYSNTPNAIYGTDEDGNWLCHIEFYDLTAGEVVFPLILREADGDFQDLSTIVGYGSQFYPGGVI